MNSDSDRNLNPSHCDTYGMRMEWAGGIPVTFDRFGTRGILDSHLCGAHRSRGVDIASSGRVPERMWHAHAGARKLASRHPAAVRGRRMRALRTLAGRRMHIAVGKGLLKQTTRAEESPLLRWGCLTAARKSVDGFFRDSESALLARGPRASLLWMRCALWHAEGGPAHRVRASLQLSR